MSIFDEETSSEMVAMFSAADNFLSALHQASEHGAEREFVAFVLEGLFRGESVIDAIAYANCEWDV